ncbi:MAG: hypothetical protein GY874_08950 [Desulfobacteraceae bacterium]|nr:hypothetical protein [Desulfobacteraceae bacterium]
MKIVVLTSSSNGIASHVLPELCANKNLNVAGVIYSRGVSLNKRKKIKKIITKTMRIGILGTINGIKLRKWYYYNEADDIYSVSRACNVPISETNAINSDMTRDLFRSIKADLGLSLGNGYILESLFSIPKFGMINIHGELLPKFQGAQSIIWPIYEKSENTGFTIHQVNKKIDGGNILYQEKFPIAYYDTLRKTVEKNLLTARSRIPKAFSVMVNKKRTQN